MQHPILLFDGNCNLCNNAVKFIIKNNTGQEIHFASLQSDFGQTICEKYNLRKTDFDSLIFVDNNQLFIKSEAVFAIINYLPKYRKFRIFKIIPKTFANFIYDIIANNRIKWFGSSEQCLLPSPELKDRFLN